ncbi:MAG: RNA polymerase sigma factor [Polyangiaceae bacterium]
MILRPSSFPPQDRASTSELEPISEVAKPLEKAEPSSPPVRDLVMDVATSPNPQRVSTALQPPPARWVAVEYAGNRAALVAGLVEGSEGAAVALFHEYASLVERTVGRVLGVDDELPDVVQEVFFRALRSVHRIRDPQALTDWLLQITICTATDWIRKRQRRRWLVFRDPVQLEEPVGLPVDEAGREAVRATYAILDRLAIEERLVFVLRYLEGMELTQVAAACDCSLATVKRRLGRAMSRFEALAKREPALSPWLDRQRESDSSEEAAS